MPDCHQRTFMSLLYNHFILPINHRVHSYVSSFALPSISNWKNTVSWSSEVLKNKFDGYTLPEDLDLQQKGRKDHKQPAID